MFLPHYSSFCSLFIPTYKYRWDESFPIKRIQLSHIYRRQLYPSFVPINSPRKRQWNYILTGTHFCPEIYSVIHTHFPHDVTHPRSTLLFHVVVPTLTSVATSMQAAQCHLRVRAFAFPPFPSREFPSKLPSCSVCFLFLSLFPLSFSLIFFLFLSLSLLCNFLGVGPPG